MSETPNRRFPADIRLRMPLPALAVMRAAITVVADLANTILIILITAIDPVRRIPARPRARLLQSGPPGIGRHDARTGAHSAVRPYNAGARNRTYPGAADAAVHRDLSHLRRVLALRIGQTRHILGMGGHGRRLSWPPFLPSPTTASSGPPAWQRYSRRPLQPVTGCIRI